LEVVYDNDPLARYKVWVQSIHLAY
jgi:hypothetical protein